VVGGDVNAHSTTWFSPYNDNRGSKLEEIINQSNHIIINEDQPTRVPFDRDQRTTSPDVTAVPSELALNATWRTLHQLASDHLPIVIEIKTHIPKDSKQRGETYTNYKEARWEEFREYVEGKMEDVQGENIHKTTKRMAKILREADKRYVPKGNIKNNENPLPTEIREQIGNRNGTRRNNYRDRTLQQSNADISREIRIHKRTKWRNLTNEEWDHRQNSNKYWKILKQIQNGNEKKEPNRAIRFRNKTAKTLKTIAEEFTKQFTRGIDKSNAGRQQEVDTNRRKRDLNKKLKKMEVWPTEITTEETRAAIKQAKNKKSLGPDGVATIHLKHLGEKAITMLTKIFNRMLNGNIIPKSWKVARIVAIPKPGK
jgi:hypothetical protein